MKNKKMKPLFIGVVAVLLITLGIVIGVAVAKDNEGDKNPTENRTEVTEMPNATDDVESTEETESVENTETFVIFGVDSRTNQLGKGAASDCIMIVNVNHDTKSVKVASVFRDTMVYIEGYKYEKITNAHSYGGPKLALSTVNENFDLNAKDYVTVNFNGVAELVNQIGGIEYYITDEECSHMGERFTGAGTYQLSGEEVVTYSRIRKATGGNFKRAERQRDMLFEIFKKSKTLPTTERVALVEEMLDKIDTSYRNDEIVELLYYLSEYEITKMDAFPKVFYNGIIEEYWVIVPFTLIDMNSALHNFLYGAVDYTPSETVEEYSAILRTKANWANYDLRD